MLKQLRPAIVSLAMLSLLTGVAYPLLVTGVAQLAFPDQANGSLVRDAKGEVRGSALIAQRFDGAQWFHERPSAGDFATVSSSASNLAPGNPALAARIAKSAADEALAGQPVPQALVTTSGSGLDPQLPPDAALYQVARIASARKLPAAELARLVEAHTERPLVGPAVVNVLALNMALAEPPQ
ncbi:potassium-transporting ATPase subunit KdpC [Pseudomonas panipatensis]|uniref:Potassium-transporting ATPase KdpC subunit n=1 Tax=Pseudomonas panipatensis TaxID=428992 RepID=A0A1G8F4Y6_9PSED|nr:potassium-transporting ATPase subunit KdpC [Pseudomonas panipatensis]SDH77213.1 K+-transporting ATPase ATPase C chain [Pseudomonas panipatensis]SMP55331.1 K+-transporting ATPase ATPase C chain [Pseudomonas panipatensis]